MPECQITAKSTKRGINANIDLTKKLLKRIDVYGSLLKAKPVSGDARQNKFLNEPKQTELAKQKHGVNRIHTNIWVTFTCHLTHHSQTALLYFFKKRTLL